MKNKFIQRLCALLICTTVLSCNAFNNDDDQGDEQLAVNIQQKVVAGGSMGITVIGLKDGVDYSVFIDDKELAQSVASSGSSASNYNRHYDIPASMQGDKEVYIKYGDKRELAGTTSVFVSTSNQLPGAAYRVDLTNIETLFSAEKFDDAYIRYHTFTLSQGQQPVEAKFYNSAGDEVAATFAIIKDISEELFFATIYNAKANNTEDGGFYFDHETFTCWPDIRPDNVQNVFVNKKSGVMLFINAPADAPQYFNQYSSFQDMGGGHICLMHESYGGAEFTESKLYTVDASQLLANDNSEHDRDDFQFWASLTLLRGQDNQDIINRFDEHWLALDRETILLNKSRKIANGNPSTTNLPKQYEGVVFGCYPQQAFYCILGDGIYNESGTNITPGTPSRYWDVYQFANRTFLRCNTNYSQLAGKVSHYSFDGGGVAKQTVEVIAQLPPQYGIIERAFPRYPCTNNYEYLLIGKKLYRRPIMALINDKAEQLLFNQYDEAYGTYISASKNAVTFIINNLVSGGNHRCDVYQMNASGVVSAKISMEGYEPTGICRLKD